MGYIMITHVVLQAQVNNISTKVFFPFLCHVCTHNAELKCWISESLLATVT